MTMEDNKIKPEDTLFSEPERWESWESALVFWCIAIGLAGLVVLGWLVNKLLLYS